MLGDEQQGGGEDGAGGRDVVGVVAVAAGAYDVALLYKVSQMVRLGRLMFGAYRTNPPS